MHIISMTATVRKILNELNKKKKRTGAAIIIQVINTTSIFFSLNPFITILPHFYISSEYKEEKDESNCNKRNNYQQ